PIEVRAVRSHDRLLHGLQHHRSNRVPHQMLNQRLPVPHQRRQSEAHLPGIHGPREIAILDFHEQLQLDQASQPTCGLHFRQGKAVGVDTRQIANPQVQHLLLAQRHPPDFC
ncbi:MAG: hypothetical protein ACK56I_34480, partial [bacterium]